MKRLFSCVAIAVFAAAPLLLSIGSAAAAPAGTFTITPNPVIAGNSVTFRGTGCLPAAGDRPGVDPTVTVSLLDASSDPSPATSAMSSASPAVAPALKGTSAAAQRIKPFADDGDQTTKPAADGTWSIGVVVPDSVVGEFSFGAFCDHYSAPSTSYPPVTLSVKTNPNTPALVFLPDFESDDPAAVAHLSTGTPYEVVGLGFDLGEKVKVLVHSEPVALTTLVADDQLGFVDGFFTLPDDTAAGNHTLTLVGQTSGKEGSLPIIVKANAVTTVTATVTATVTVTASSSPQSGAASTTEITAQTSATGAGGNSGTGPTLAATGTPAEDQSLIGVALIVLGATTLLFARRRSPRIH